MTATYFTESPAPLRAQLLERLRTVTSADVAAWYDVDADGIIVGVQALGPEAYQDAISRFRGARWPAGAASTPAPERIARLRRQPFTLPTAPKTMRTSFRTMRDDFVSEEAIASLPVFKALYEPFGLVDQLRLLAFAEERFVGWIAVKRKGGIFAEAERKRANRLIGAVVEGLAAARCLEQLDDDPCLVFTPEGRVERGTERALAWLNGPRSEVFRRCVRAADRGEQSDFSVDGVGARVVRLDGEGGPRYLAMLRERGGIELAPAACLTSSEREIAEDLASGLRIREVAELRGRAEATVKTQARTIYRKLGVASRLELARALAPV